PLGAGEASGRLNHRIARIALPIAATSLLGNLMGSVCAILIPQKLVQGGMEVSASISAFGVMFGMTLPLLT
ncbi:stage V sporulation protein B, partial [Akkermansia sp. GGCC_0220]|nr:stage V sporulation protein B [Akkermansia sp. GGCC_0220]